MTPSREVGYLRQLERRRDLLRRRLEEPWTGSRNGLDRLRHEMKALEWAISVCRSWLDEDSSEVHDPVKSVAQDRATRKRGAA